MSSVPSGTEEQSQQPPRGHVRILYLGPVAPHWDLQSAYGDRVLIEEFRRNRERVARDAERENLLLEWDLGIPEDDETSG